MTTLVLLEEALSVLRRRGLAKGVFEDEQGRVCARGALRAVLWDRTATERAFVGSAGERALAEAIWDGAEFKGACGPLVAHWNNAPERTQSEVEAAFTRAIARLRGCDRP